jgi:hypothetical protein
MKQTPILSVQLLKKWLAGHLFKLSKMESDKKHFTTRILYFASYGADEGTPIRLKY